ncbi:MAG: OmpP1/FadL family transporter [Stappiaceae bacterium]
MKVTTLRRSGLLISTALAFVLVAENAFAGAFALREQSAYYQGLSFAGNATSGPSISSMFWNPASITGAGEGFTFEAHNSFIVPYSDIDGTYSGNGGGLAPSTIGSGDIASDAWIPATYMAYGLTEDIVLGLGINAPYGLATKPQFDWAGQYYSRSSEVFSINVNPTIAYKINEMISVGVGVQAQYLQVRLKTADPFSAGAVTNEVKGDDIAFGVTAGVTATPFAGTEVGLGFRSAVWHQLEGDLVLPRGIPTVLAAGTYGIDANIATPEMITLSAKQRITDDIRVLGSVEWTNWSRLGEINVDSTANGATLTDLKFNYNDGWFFALGGEYDWNEDLTLRAGFAYEVSPIDTDIRSTRLPDNNRFWLSAGLSYSPMENLSLDLGYSHIIPEETDIEIVPGHQDYDARFGTYVGNVSSHVDILSASLRYSF